MSGDDGFLSRWARRKADARRSLPAPAPEAAAAPPPSEAEQPFDVASLPSLDSLTGSSDITMFLQKGVPAELQRAALSAAWTSDPVIRDYIGPAEYQWDFHAPGAITGYGDLTSGTDIGQLVADVTDYHLKPAVPQAPELIAQQPPDESAPPVRVALDALPVGSAEAVDDVVEQDADAPFPRRRRHGGAAPR